ncbi:MAG: TonB-dependent receptor [Flavobacteriaceae bacterium]|nr:TonB-dependent receptor [Flavobacteriaceae bacterium]
MAWILGAKHSNIETDSDLQSFLKLEDTFEFQDDESNHFIVDEAITAVYSKLNATTQKWSFSGGLRYEYSKTIGTASETADSRSREISKLFPNASIIPLLN